MKYFGFFILFFSILFSCNVPKEEKNISGTSTIDSLQKDSSLKTKPKGKLLLIARGSEPGWYAEFYADHLRLLINNGTDSLHLDQDFSTVVSQETYKKTIIEASSSNSNEDSLSLVIKIEQKQCNEANGDTLERSISLRYNNQNFKGCAHSEPK